MSRPVAPSSPDRASEPFLLRPWTGPLASPPLDEVEAGEIEPAMEAGFAAHRAEIDAIVGNPEPATFGNTIARLEDGARPLNRALSLFATVSGVMSDNAMQQVEQVVWPRLAAHGDAVNHTPGLYERVQAVSENRALENLTPEQARVAERYEVILTRAGARLSDQDKARASELNQILARLTTAFSQNLLADEEGYALELTEADMARLPQALTDDYAAHAREKASAAAGLVANTRSAMEPFLTFCPDRSLREKGWRMWMSRGDNGDAHDNKQIISDILKARQAYARLLGYKSYADFKLEDSMAKTPASALNLIARVWAPAAAAVRDDVVRYQAMADSEGADFRIAPWDYRYYAEKVRKADYNVATEEVKPFLRLDQMRQAAFWCATRLYGVTFEPRGDVAVYHPDVQVWTVKDAAGREAGLFYADPYARAGKNSGAWMSQLRSEESFEGPVLPLVVNCTNFSKPEPGKPALMSLDDVITLFHEFGHGLHGLLSKTAYPLVSGTNVYRDFVELPSQVNEHWALRPELLARFATHHVTGEPMPQDLIDRITAANRFNQGFNTVEMLACCWVDMELHTADASAGIDVAEFEKASLARLGMPGEIVMRHRPTQFGHLFSGDGYAAGYYSYLWSQVLDHDAFAAWEETGDVFDPKTSRRFRHEILERGDSRDPAQSWRAFRGRDPDIQALLRNRGFA